MDKEIAAARQALQHVPLMAGSIIGGALGKLDRALKEKDAEIESLKRKLAEAHKVPVIVSSNGGVLPAGKAEIINRAFETAFEEEDGDDDEDY